MAKRRMFSLDVVDTDQFLDMPSSARLLYYDLGVRADDDGFLQSAQKICRFTGASQDDLKSLIDEGFVIPFKSGVIVIRHWFMNNQLRKDRYTPTVCKVERSHVFLDENSVYEFTETPVTDRLPDGCRLVANLEPQVREDQIREDQERVVEERTAEGRSTPPPAAAPSSAAADLQQIAVDLVNKYGLPVAKSVFNDVRHDLETYGGELVKQAFDQAALSDSRGGLSMAFYRSVLGRLVKEASA